MRVLRPHGRDRLSDFTRAPKTFRYLEAEHATYIINVHHVVELAEETPYSWLRWTPASSRPPASAPPQSGSPIDRLFHAMSQIGASDLHLCVGIAGAGAEGRPHPAARSEHARADRRLPEAARSIRSCRRRIAQEFAEKHDTDFAYEVPNLARFRANVFADRKGRGAVFRVIPSEILTAEKLGLSQHILNLCKLNKGLVLVTGPTGSGKSTTLCAMIDYINRTRDEHIITIEDPIEFVHQNNKCLINQREVRTHTNSFKAALRAALREDPDIVLVGELRDLETVAIAIETAETGHLVFGTLHTTTAASTVDRIIDQFPSDRQAQIRIMLSESLRGVIAQTLCRKIGGGRVAALEVLIANGAVSNLIREGKTFQIPSLMQVNKAIGMVSLNDALFELVTKKLVAPDEAYSKSVDKAGSSRCSSASASTSRRLLTAAVAAAPYGLPSRAVFFVALSRNSGCAFRYASTRSFFLNASAMNANASAMRSSGCAQLSRRNPRPGVAEALAAQTRHAARVVCAFQKIQRQPVRRDAEPVADARDRRKYVERTAGHHARDAVDLVHARRRAARPSSGTPSSSRRDSRARRASRRPPPSA